VQCQDLHPQSVILLVPVLVGPDNLLTSWVEFPLPVTPSLPTGPTQAPFYGALTPWTLAKNCTIPPGGSGQAAATTTTPTLCNAVYLTFNSSLMGEIFKAANSTTIRIQVHGDLIRDNYMVNNAPSWRAVDGNHLPPWLPNVPKTGDEVEGGLFESWTTLNFNT